jgi:hypothetical protein
MTPRATPSPAKKLRRLGARLAVLLSVILVALLASATAALAASPPQVTPWEMRNITTSSARVEFYVKPFGLETHWRFESAKAPGGPWTLVPGAAGTITKAQAEQNLTEVPSLLVRATLTGLSPDTAYYVRVFAESEAGEGINGEGEPISTEKHGVEAFTTFGPPIPVTFAAHALHGESIRLLGSVDPNGLATSDEQTIAIEGAPTGGTFALIFNGHRSASLPYNASQEEVVDALRALDTEVQVHGQDGGPYTVIFFGADAGVAEPQIEADSSGLTPSGSVSVATTQQGGEAFDTHYHFEYITEAAFNADGGSFGAGTESTPVVDLGSGGSAEPVGEDVPGLKPGESYRYRLAATSTYPGNPVVYGETQSLTVPAAASGTSTGACANEAFRVGLSAHLPDCRAYEQISPVDKEGAQEALKYAAAAGGTLPGEDGDHFMFMTNQVRWGAGPEAGQAPYFFTREEGRGWRMTAATAQPEAGFDKYSPQLFTPDLTQFAFTSTWSTAGECNPVLGVNSKELTFEAGPPGGPYAAVASIPCNDVGGEQGWVAASPDFSKLILGVEDRTLLGPSTGTRSGEDLYEYTAASGLRQVNVDSAGHTIGTCGARIVKGYEASAAALPASAHAVSADGSRVFFEAAPGECSVMHLYMREAAANRTLDIGAYRFAGANAEGTEVLLEQLGGEGTESHFFLDETGPGTVKPAFSASTERSSGGSGSGIVVSRDFDAVYVFANAQLTPEAPANSLNVFRYDVAEGRLRFVVPLGSVGEGSLSGGARETSPDGRYLYFRSRQVVGLPGGAKGQEGEASEQLYRYDSAENVVECVSCASPFDPEPRLSVNNAGGSLSSEWPTEGNPARIFSSADGDYAFFETPSRLVPQDANGEVPPEGVTGAESERRGGTPSNDVYEWRRVGVNGCGAVQGCLSLITPGTDGYLVSLLGTDEAGRDVFFYTSSQLVPQDDDTAGDFYDARIGGGFPTPVKQVECEGDACFTPLAAPIDQTPASSTFQGPGNPLGSSAPPVVSKAKPKPKSKSKPCKRRGRKKCGATARKTGKHARKAASGRGARR